MSLTSVVLVEYNRTTGCERERETVMITVKYSLGIDVIRAMKGEMDRKERDNWYL